MHHVAKHVGDAPMPEQDPDTEGNLLGPFDHHVDDVVKVAIEEDSVSQVWTGRSIELLVYVLTYLFAVGSFLGLISSFLNAAKYSSTGDAEYE